MVWWRATLDSPTKFSLSQLPPDRIARGPNGVLERLRRGPQINATAFVATNATIVGDVACLEDSSVWYGAVLRGDINRIVLGPRSNVQDGAVIHLADEFPALIGELVTIGHRAIVHACTIENEVLIGMGTTILDGAIIGERSIVGANSLVTMRTKIPPGSLVVGSPARVVRLLSSEEQTGIASWAKKYVEIARTFRQHASQ